MKTINDDSICYCPRCGAPCLSATIIVAPPEYVVSCRCSTCNIRFIIHCSCPQRQQIDRDTTVEWTKKRWPNRWPGWYCGSLMNCRLDSLIVNSNGQGEYDPQLSVASQLSEGICSECLRLFDYQNEL